MLQNCDIGQLSVGQSSAGLSHLNGFFPAMNSTRNFSLRENKRFKSKRKKRVKKHLIFNLSPWEDCGASSWKLFQGEEGQECNWEQPASVPKGALCLSGLIAFYKEMTGSVDEGRAPDNV